MASIWAERSMFDRAVRVVLCALIVALGYHSITQSIAQLLVKRNPALAHRLAPGNGRITAAYSGALSGPQATSAERVRADQLARLALRQDPTTVAAVATLGFNAQVRGDTPTARRYFAYAQRLSRRDLRTQLWSIEDAVARENVHDALRWYDAALRTSRKLDELLFPILASASEDPAIRVELIRTLADNPIWGQRYIGYAAGNGPDPRLTATLFRGLLRAKVPIPDVARVGVIDALIRKRHFREAWSFYETIRPGVDRLRSRDPGFLLELPYPTQFDWAPVNSGDISTSIRDKSFSFLIQPSAGGVLLSQKQLLDAGRYRLSGVVAELVSGDGAAPYWVLACEDGRELGRLSLPGASEQAQKFSAVLIVPADCPVQTLTLMRQLSDSTQVAAGRIDRAELARIPS